MTGITDGHNIEVGSTPLDRLNEAVATNVALQTHINDNTDPHGSLLRQTTIAINDTADIMSSGNGLKIVDYNNIGILRDLLLANIDVRGNMDVADNFIKVNSQVSSSPTLNGGIEVERGTGINAYIMWDEVHDYWAIADETVSSITHRLLDQRDRDALDLRDDNIENDLHTNYVHKTGNVAESVTGNKTFTDNVVVSGDFTVNGTTTTVNTAELNVSDNIVNLNNDVTGTPTENSGINVVRGTSADTSILWNEGSDTWTLTDDGSNYYKITDQRDVDAIYAAMTGNYVHRTGSVNESISGSKTFTSATYINNTLTVQSTAYLQGQLNINDNIITLNYDVSASPSENAGIQIERGTSANTAVVWNETTDYWALTNDGSNYYRIITTNDEGSGKGFDADTVDGYHAAISNEADKAVVRDASGNINIQDTILLQDGTAYKSSSNNPYYYDNSSWKKIWYEGNDGPGSTLNADLLDNYHGNVSAVANTYALRDSNADINARLFKSNYAAQTTSPATSADICFRTNNSSDNYMRFMTNGAFSSWCQNAHIKSYDSILLSGLALHAGRNNEANKVVRTDSNGYLNTGWIDTTSGDAGTNTISRVYASYDGFIRYYSLANFAAQVLVQGSVTNAHTHTFLRVPDTRSVNDGPNAYNNEFTTEFKYRSTVDSPGTSGTYCGVITFAPWNDTSGGNGYQLAFTMGNGLALRTGDLNASSWGAWAKIWHSANDGHGSGLDADVLDGAQPATAATAGSITQRDGAGDITARLFRSTYGEQNSAPATSADICFRNNTSDNYMRFMTNAAFSTWCQNASITTYNSVRAGGLLVHTGRNNEGNKVVRTDGNGYLQTGYINTTSGDSGTATIGRVYASSDSYIRYYTPLNFANQILTKGSAKNAHTHPEYAGVHTASLTTTFYGMATGTDGALYVALPSGVPQNSNSYRVSVTATDNTYGALGDLFVYKASSYIYVYRTGSYQATIDIIFSWN